jgi:hypothetical protein
MYLTPNFYTFTVPCYIGGQSASSFIQFISAWELRREARLELLKYKPKVDVEGLYAAAELALCSLDNLIGRRKRIDTEGKPSLLEATLFAYLFLLLELPLQKWADPRLVELVRKHSNLVAWEKHMSKVFGKFQPPGIYDV